MLPLATIIKSFIRKVRGPKVAPQKYETITQLITREPVRTIQQTFDHDILIIKTSEPLVFDADLIIGFGPDGNFRRL